MAGFHFNNSSGFEDNLKAFLDFMNNEDAELGAILATEAHRLKGATDDIRRKAARTNFNGAVKTALDKKLAEKKTGGGQ